MQKHLFFLFVFCAFDISLHASEHMPEGFRKLCHENPQDSNCQYLAEFFSCAKQKADPRNRHDYQGSDGTWAHFMESCFDYAYGSFRHSAEELIKVHNKTAEEQKLLFKEAQDHLMNLYPQK